MNSTQRTWASIHPCARVMCSRGVSRGAPGAGASWLQVMTGTPRGRWSSSHPSSWSYLPGPSAIVLLRSSLELWGDDLAQHAGDLAQQVRVLGAHCGRENVHVQASV